MLKYKTACNNFIHVSLRVQSHLEAHSDVITHLEETVGRIQLPTDGKILEIEVPMGRIVGRGGVIKTLPLDRGGRTLFALRTNRPFPSRVAPPGALGIEAETIVIIARPSRLNGGYDLITSWVGILAKKEPWDMSIRDDGEFAQSLKFWCTTALVYDQSVMGTVFESSWDDELRQAQTRFPADACTA